MIVIATPTRGAGLAAPVTLGYSESVRKLAAFMPVETLPPTIGFYCDVVRARNRIAALVMRERKDATHILWWDDDEWPDDIMLIKKMIESGEDLIAAPYTNKFPPIRWLHKYKDDVVALDDRGLLEVDCVAMGLTLMSRKCIEAVSAKADIYLDMPRPDHIANIFGMMYTTWNGERVLLSEDYSFCQRWRDIGGKIWIYGAPGNMVRHVGPKEWSAQDMPRGMVER